MLERHGDRTPPCGTPLSVAFHTQSSKYPACSIWLISLSSRLSRIFSPSVSSMTRESSRSKHWEMSPSINQLVPVQVLATSPKAVWQPRPGR